MSIFSGLFKSKDKTMNRTADSVYALMQRNSETKKSWNGNTRYIIGHS